jgi:hypothetical protein
MGIAGFKPRQLAPTVGTTGSGSTDSPAPSPTIIDLSTLTRVDGSSSATTIDSALPTAIDITSLAINIDVALSAVNIDINVDTTSPTIVGIAAPTIINTTSPTAVVDIASPSIFESTPMLDVDSSATTTIDPISRVTGTIVARIGGFDMAFGPFNFHVDNDGAAELISINESTLPAVDPSTPPAIGALLR